MGKKYSGFPRFGGGFIRLEWRDVLGTSDRSSKRRSSLGVYSSAGSRSQFFSSGYREAGGVLAFWEKRRRVHLFRDIRHLPHNDVASLCLGKHGFVLVATVSRMLFCLIIFPIPNTEVDVSLSSA